MAHTANFTAQLDPSQLDALRQLAKHLGFVLPTGHLTGRGSPRRIMVMLAEAVKANGVKRVAATLRDLLPDTEAKDS